LVADGIQLVQCQSETDWEAARSKYLPKFLFEKLSKAEENPQ
jgi:hypothetical protein